MAIRHAYSCPAELQTSEDDIVLTFNCNTPSLDGLVDREYMCTLCNHNLTTLLATERRTDIPQVVRVNASLVIYPESTSNPTAVAVASDSTSQIVTYVLSALSAVIFILAAVFVVFPAIKARVAKLRAAGIQPTLKRVVFLQKTLSKYRPLLESNDRNGSLQVR